MKLRDILALTGASKKSIYRWMEAHPTISVPDPDSLLGHAFPRPADRDGRAMVWDAEAVSAWWRQNGGTIGRHPEDAAVIEIGYRSFRRATLMQPVTFENDDGSAAVEDDIASIRKFEVHGDKVRIWFGSVGDAVMFKLKYAGFDHLGEECDERG